MLPTVAELEKVIGETGIDEDSQVIIVPAGVPHWFKSVDGPFLYYVVKVPSPERKP